MTTNIINRFRNLVNRIRFALAETVCPLRAPAIVDVDCQFSTPITEDEIKDFKPDNSLKETLENYVQAVATLYKRRAEMADDADRLEKLLSLYPNVEDPDSVREAIAYMRFAAQSACDFGVNDCNTITSI